jgi:hypothetical protein
VSTELALSYLRAWHPDGTFPELLPDHPGKAQILLSVLAPLFEGPDQAPYREAPYYEDFEKDADQTLLEAAAVDPMQIQIGSLSEGRVLFERYRQALIVIMANEAANETVLVPHESLPFALRHSSTVLLWLHQMRLPFFPGTTHRKF